MNSKVKKDMHLLVVALLDDSYLDEVILGIESISGAQVTMVDAVSGTENLSQSIPMFAEFIGMAGKKFCKLLLACVSEPNPAASLLEGLKEGGLDFIGSGLGEIYSIPLSEAVLAEDIDVF